MKERNPLFRYRSTLVRTSDNPNESYAKLYLPKIGEGIYKYFF